ncbi:GNAT family N-acetyltransferase [Acetobacteroides hydrogenigenes]|uniref:Ribosomal protein S18 acetylase RimI-like enzyme n=1 Tax=Acetobacteroides hydrogenigenes TaxID=979970 RepID=A0A4V2RPR1_9BACT|nr:GNAT family N-acetyltransferase [Acetobacteroides hydrogenigenes]TCN68580.1 ribosomal protein S18 acetylase RimI-like enzyme [Acetobacteroides hydrogenigenes]
MIEYHDIGPSQIERIKHLWIRNREYHEQSEPVFKEQYANLVFEDRMSAILDGDKELKITIAEEDENVYGYCISTVSGHTGEVVSLHVLHSQRRKGIGRQLMRLHIEWLKDKRCKEIGLYVSSCNENSITFYKELGFYPNLLYMQVKE